ncbi:hypothetical protein PENTCL1PPCAC_2954, partial [Pristionchus entomophagus]
QMNFMHQTEHFRIDQSNDFGTALIMPYLDEKFNFFYLMPHESSNLVRMRRELTGETLVNVLKSAKDTYLNINVPKLKIDAALDGVRVLHEMGVRNLFNIPDLSKMSSTPLRIEKILHQAVIETDELGTEAAAVTATMHWLSGVWMPVDPPEIFIDHPFLFGIIRDDDILFLGQFA